MKIRLLILIFLSLMHTGCIKTMATEEEKSIPTNYHDQNFGSSAHDLLSSETFTALKVEIQYMEGFKPDLGAIVQLEKFLKKHLHKPGGITIVTKEIEAASVETLTREDVIRIERENRQFYSYGEVLTLYFLYTNGDYINPKILGEAYRNTSAVIYGKTILQNTGKVGKPNRTKLESTILLHETGHLLGLVNKGSSVQSEHVDGRHASHCSNKECLMYWSNGLEDKFGHLLRGAIPELDADCLEDLKKNGGR
jgi:hypothetical protein